jgi:hypothetical protein
VFEFGICFIFGNIPRIVETGSAQMKSLFMKWANFENFGLEISELIFLYKTNQRVKFQENLMTLTKRVASQKTL